MAIHFQQVQRPDLAPLALLVRKFGVKIEGGGFEVVITPADSLKLTADGTFQETKDVEGNVHWQYFPNHTINGEFTIVVEAAPEQLPEP
jgi:hypothetical protein